MDVYIQNQGLRKNLQILKKIRDSFLNEVQFSVCIISETRVSRLHIISLGHIPKVMKIKLVAPAKKISNSIISLANKKPRFKLSILVDKKLSNITWKKICKINDIIWIYDTSNCPQNQEKYISNRKVVYKTPLSNNEHIAKIYMLSTGAIDDCRYNSCLGNTLYVSMKDTISFCPKHPQESKLTTLNNLSSTVFENENYYTALFSMIDTRDSCIENCKFYNICQGGCFFERDCKKFTNIYTACCEDLSNIFSTKQALNTLPLYKEKTILHNLFFNLNEEIYQNEK